MYGESPEENGDAIKTPIKHITIAFTTITGTGKPLYLSFFSSKSTSRSMCRYLSSVEMPEIVKNANAISKETSRKMKPNQAGSSESCINMKITSYHRAL